MCRGCHIVQSNAHRVHQLWLGFMYISVEFQGGEEREARRKQYLIHIVLWQTSQKHQGNSVNPTPKQKLWSTERKHKDA